MPKREVKLTDWCIGFRNTSIGFIVCLEGIRPDGTQVWTSLVVKNRIEKGIIESVITRYAVQGQPREFYTIRKGQVFFDRNNNKVGMAYNFGSKAWWFKSKYYKSLWQCQVAADLYVLRRKVKELNSK